jgi:hypothetical protein
MLLLLLLLMLFLLMIIFHSIGNLVSVLVFTWPWNLSKMVSL